MNGKILKNRGNVPRKIKGFRDIDESLNQLRWQVIDSATKVYHSYGFEHLDTPILEYADCLGKYLPDRDTVDEGVYSFKNPEQEPVLGKDGHKLKDRWNKMIMENQHLSLRYDLTAPLARVYAERLWHLYLRNQIQEGRMELFRRYQFGSVFRFEKKIDVDRFREFWQLDFDSVGTKNVATDAEVCMVLADTMENIGLKRNTYLVNVNNRKILKGFLQSIGVNNTLLEGNILRILDKVDKIGLQAMIQELGEGRIDEKSGSKVAGLKLDKIPEINFEQLTNSLVLFYEKFKSLTKRSEVLKALSDFKITNDTFIEGLNELEKIDSILNGLGFDENRVVFSPTLVRGMAYYTGPIFEVESLQQYEENGKVKQFGSIAGGGRYDGLVKSLLGISVPATGASIGVDRLCELLKLNQNLENKRTGPVLIINFGDNLMVQYQKVARNLRAVGINSEVYIGDQRSLKKQMNYADKRNSPIVIFMGEDEIKKGAATIKDLKLGMAMKNIKNKEDWKKKVQVEVPLNNLVNKILDIIN